MSTSLRNRLSDLASAFAVSIMDAIRGASLEELQAGTPSASTKPSLASKRATAPSTHATAPASSGGTRSRGRRLPRRSEDEISAVVDQIAELLGRHPEGLRAEQIRTELDLAAKELPRPLKEGLESARFAKSGRKRATTYFVKSARVARATKAEKSRKPAGAKKAPSARKAAKKVRRRESPRSQPVEAVESPKSDGGPDTQPAGTEPAIVQDP
jgi:hypothetical protein